MRLLFFDDYRPGILTESGIVPIDGAVRLGRDGQETLEHLIADFPDLADRLGDLSGLPPPIEPSTVRLRAPVPWPGKIVGMAGNYLEGLDLPPRSPRGFIIPPDAVLEPGGTVVFPTPDFPICEHEAELVCVIGKRGKDVPEQEAMDYVFGYTVGCDISPRRADWRHIGKGCDGFKPIGPWIVTADEIPDPNDLSIRLSVDGVLRQDYRTNDLGHGIPACIAWVTAMMTIRPGDLLFTGVNHQGLGPLQDGESVEITIERIGSLSFHVSDPRKRAWPKEIDTEIAEHARNQIRKAASQPVDPGTVRPY